MSSVVLVLSNSGPPLFGRLVRIAEAECITNTTLLGRASVRQAQKRRPAHAQPLEIAFDAGVSKT